VARMLGIPRDLPGAAAVIADGAVAALDVGRAGQTYFLEAAGVGIDAALFRYTNQLDQGRWTALAHAARVAVGYRPRRVVIQLDWWTVEMDALMVTIANGPYCGASFSVAPGAVVDDHQFDVRVYGLVSKWSLLRRLLRSDPMDPTSLTSPTPPTDPIRPVDDAHTSTGRVYSFKARDVRISAPRPLPGHADSLPIGDTPLRFSLMSGALSVFVPVESRARHAALSHPPAHQYVEASVS
jgi:diacylglycerol kinase (ATP)